MRCIRLFVVLVLLAISFADAKSAELPIADINGYVPSDRYHPIITPGSGDTCAGGYTCLSVPAPTGGHGVDCDSDNSQVNSQDSSQYFITPNGGSPFAGIDNTNHSYTDIFICPGDYTGDGILDLIKSGTSGTFINYVYWDSDAVEDADTTAYHMASSQRAHFRRIVLDGDYMWLDRLTWTPTPGYGTILSVEDDADDIFLTRFYCYGDSKDADCVSGTNSSNQDLYVGDSVMGPMNMGNDVDNVGVSCNGADNVHIINNEIWGVSDHVTGSCEVNCPCDDLWIENNDLYVDAADQHTRLIGNPGGNQSFVCPPAGSGDSDGEYAAAENYIDLKGGAANISSSTPIVIRNNRFWGMRGGGSGNCNCTGSGSWRNHGINIWDHNQYIAIDDNTFLDSNTSTISCANNGQGSGCSNISIRRNIFADITSTDERQSSATSCGGSSLPVQSDGYLAVDTQSSVELLLNTFYNVKQGTGDGETGWIIMNDTSNVDAEGNMVINSDALSGSLPSTGYLNYSAFINTNKSYKSSDTEDQYSKSWSTWGATSGKSIGDLVVATSSSCSSVTDSGCFVYQAEGNCTTGGAEPSWGSILGGTTQDNNCSWEAILGPHSFYRQLKTTSGDLVVIGRIVPYAGWGEAETLAGVTLGRRSGYGIDNNTVSALSSIPGALLSSAIERPASNENGYINTYELPVLSSGDTCRSGYTCKTAPTVCDQEIAPGDAWGTITQSNTVTCLEKGDHRAKGTLVWTSGGTPGGDIHDCTAYKWIVSSDGAGNIDVASNTYLKADVDKTKLTSLYAKDDCILVAGIDFLPTTVSAIDEDGSGSNSVFIWNVAIDGSGLVGDTGVGIEANDGWVVQYSVIHDLGPTDGHDHYAISLGAGDDDVVVVSNEIFNVSDGVHAGSVPTSENDVKRLIIENNDFHVTSSRHVACDDTSPFTLGVSPANNTCHCGGNGIHLKGGGSGSADGPRIIQNRFMDFPPGITAASPACGSTGISGAAMRFNNRVDYSFLANNIFVGNQHNVLGVDAGYPTENNTIQGNIIADPEKFYTSAPDSNADLYGITVNTNFDKGLIWFNSLVGFPDVLNVTWVDIAETDLQFACNLGFDGRSVGTSPGGFVNYSMLIEDTDSPGGTNNLSYTAAQALQTQYCFSYKLLTNPTQYCISDVRPTTSSPYLGGCGASQQTGYGYNG